MIESLRTALLITLAILVAVILYRRIKRYYRVHHMPIPRHMDLLAVEVMYHPPVLRVHIAMPAPGEVFPAMLSDAHAPLAKWPSEALGQGTHVLELPLQEGVEGHFFFEIATATQRTERKFTVRQG